MDLPKEYLRVPFLGFSTSKGVWILILEKCGKIVTFRDNNFDLSCTFQFLNLFFSFFNIPMSQQEPSESKSFV